VAAPADPTPDACADAVMDVVPAVMDAVRGAMRKHVGPQLSVPQFRCLAFIEREPGGSIGAVASFLGVTMPTASAMVDRLVRAGAVLPSADPGDRRRLRLHITPAGGSQLDKIRSGARDDLAHTLATREPAALRALLAGLDELRRCFDPAVPSMPSATPSLLSPPAPPSPPIPTLPADAPVPTVA
jgi:DNA-binding MarR family transcriptional regulator